MSDETKAKAQEKLSTFTVKIGYPDKWKDYSTLEIDPAKSYWENIVAVNKWYIADNLSKLGKPVDKEEWQMSPQTVNAYYSPLSNEICFPAAILQPPFYNPDADDAVNYGAIGVVIGHEMTHGFDDQGRQFDKDGNMNNWWTDADAEAFKKKTDILVKQFDAIEVLPARDGQPAVYANGALCLGENIADQGGLRVAYGAAQCARHLGRRADRRLHARTAFLPRLCNPLGAEHPRRGDRTPDQRRRALAGQVARERHAAQHSGVLRRLRHRRRSDVHARRRARNHHNGLRFARLPQRSCPTSLI